MKDNFLIRKADQKDLEEFKRLVRVETGLPSNPFMLDCLTNYPAVAAEDREGNIIGLVYTSRYTKDILGMAQILVIPEYRNLGIGEQMIELLESLVEAPFEAMIVSNTDLYPSLSEEKRPATSFYLNNGYQLVASTNNTRVFFKDLRSDK